MFRKRIEKKIQAIRNDITLAGSLGLEMLDKAIKSLQTKDEKLAEEVIDVLEPKLDDLEIVIEKKCIAILAMFKLQVTHLRAITMYLKMNDDLERVGDLAAGIAICCKKIIANEKKVDTSLLKEIGAKTYAILLKSNQSLKNEDLFIAYEVLKMDNEINKMRDEKIKSILDLLKKTTDFLVTDYELIKIVQKLERIGDLSKNIAEEVIYIISGELLKHGKKQ